MRTIFLSLILLFSAPVFAQTRPEAVTAIKAITEDVTAYINAIKDQPTKKNLDYLTEKFNSAVAVWTEPFVNGSITDQMLMSYYSTVIYFRMGYMYSGMERPKDAYYYYRQLPASVQYLLVDRGFPIKYELGDYTYALDNSYIKTIAPIFYNDMVAVLAKLEKWKELENVGKEALELGNISAYKKYFISTLMIEAGKKRNIDNDTLLDYYLQNIKSITKLDTAEKRFIKENNYPDYELRNEEVKALLPKLKHKFDPYVKTARLYWEIRDTTKGKEFFTLLLNEGTWDEYVLKDAGEFAIAINNKELGLRIVATIKAFPHPENNCVAVQTAAKVSEAFGYKSEAKYFRRKSGKCEKRLKN